MILLWLFVALLVMCFSFEIGRKECLSGVLIEVDHKREPLLTNGDYSTFVTLASFNLIRVYCETPFRHVYLIYHHSSAPGILHTRNKHIVIGDNGVLHELVSLEQDTNLCWIQYHQTVNLSLIFAFQTKLPDWVQRWETNPDTADLLLVAAHADDEQLYFAGLLPTMINMRRKVQVLYMISHPSHAYRMNEQLNGLWAIGIKRYPIFGIVPDHPCRDLTTAFNLLSQDNLTIEHVIKHVVDSVRRFQPEVVVTHDMDGEYGHGQHRLTAFAVKEAIHQFCNPKFPSSFRPYQPLKVYFHLHNKCTITMNYDVPLDFYHGLTAFEVAKMGFREHQSQIQSRYTPWLEGPNRSYTKATQIQPHSPLKFGLYYSQVGCQSGTNDLFAGITSDCADTCRCISTRHSITIMLKCIFAILSALLLIYFIFDRKIKVHTRYKV